MKKITIFLICFLAHLNVEATVIIDETFSSIPNPQTSSTTETSGGWTVTNGTTFNNCSRTTNTGGLKYPASGTEYINSQAGNTLSNQYIGISNGTSYAAKQISASAISTGSVYLSFIINLTQLGTNAQIIALCPDATASKTVALWGGNVSSGSTYKLGITRGSTSNSAIVYNSNTLSFGTNYFVVLKYDFSNSTATLYINPTISGLESGETAWVTDNSSDNTKLPASLSYIVQRGNGANRSVWSGSGLRISSVWSEAVAAKSSATSLSSPTISSATSITSSGFTANWTPVSNASGYEIKTYAGGSNLVSTTSVSGQSTSSGVVSGLLSGVDYTYKVIAVGDGTSYSNSDASSAENFTTSGRVSSISTDLNDGSWGTIASTLTSGSYGSTTINGFDLNAAAVYTGTTKGVKGESHTNRIGVDKLSNGGKISFPTVNSIEQLEIHATAGTGGNSFQVKEYNSATNSWDVVSTCTYSQYTKNFGLDSVYIINISRSQPAKFRIENPSNGIINICQIITRTSAMSGLSIPTTGMGPGNITNSGFQADWTTVSNADSYDIRVFRVNGDGTYSQVTTTLNGNSITGLSSNTSYFYRVFAKNTGNTFLNSYLSLPSATFTTLYDYNVSTNVNFTTLGSSASSKVLVTSGNTLTLDENTTLNTLSIEPGAKVTLSNSKTLTVTSLTLQSNASTTATFVDENTNGASVNATVQQYLTAGRNWYVSAPVSSFGRTNFSSAGSVVRYNEPTATWLTQTADSTFHPLRGYISTSTASTGNISFTGTLNTGELYIDLTRTAGVAKSGFNLVGNPYPSYLSWDAAGKTNLEQTIWFRSRNALNTAYIFDTYNATSHEGTSLNGTAVSTYIPPMQAFWVRVSEGHTSGRFTVNNPMRSHGSGSNPLKVPAIHQQQVLRLQVSNGTNADETLLLFNPNASNQQDNFDSQKMSNSNNSLPEIYTLVNNNELVINGLNSIEFDKEYPLGFRTGEVNSFALLAKEIRNFSSDIHIILKDKQINTETELTEKKAYTFSSDVYDSNQRFSIIFKSSASLTGLPEKNATALLICKNNKHGITILNPENITGEISVYNMQGMILFSAKLQNNSNRLDNLSANGMYIVSIKTGDKTTTQKIIVD